MYKICIKIESPKDYSDGAANHIDEMTRRASKRAIILLNTRLYGGTAGIKLIYTELSTVPLTRGGRLNALALIYPFSNCLHSSPARLEQLQVEHSTHFQLVLYKAETNRHYLQTIIGCTSFEG